MIQDSRLSIILRVSFVVIVVEKRLQALRALQVSSCKLQVLRAFQIRYSFVGAKNFSPLQMAVHQ
jgi:diphthamide synthase subunit DPH2